MGMYTALHLGVDLKKDTPHEVINTLKYMLEPHNDPRNPPPTPAHALFFDTRWQWMLLSDSYYFRHDTHSVLTTAPSGYITLSVTCNLKNYDSEIEKFLDWITPYVDACVGDFLGYMRYEGDDPVLLYWIDSYCKADLVDAPGKIVFKYLRFDDAPEKEA